ncbi:hypothetical protein [Accumulibacter sp.]|uniref:hypothetical protein n=1 Tax=Accumulibacter sp. TaxID=2053492 RepID=UPI0026380165|nr:hypothetical protein [Accumulibacter sp.]
MQIVWRGAILSACWGNVGIMRTQQFSAEGIGRGGDQALKLEAAVALYRGETDEAQDELTQDSQVVSGMIGESLHLVVGKSHIHTPMHANALIHAQGVRRQAADIGTPLC